MSCTPIEGKSGGSPSPRYRVRGRLQPSPSRELTGVGIRKPSFPRKRESTKWLAARQSRDGASFDKLPSTSSGRTIYWFTYPFQPSRERGLGCFASRFVDSRVRRPLRNISMIRRVLVGPLLCLIDSQGRSVVRRSVPLTSDYRRSADCLLSRGFSRRSPLSCQPCAGCTTSP